MRCVSLDEVTFTQSSKTAIEEIRGVSKSWNALSKILPGSVMLTIFAGNKPLASAYNISQTDFKLWQKL